MTLGHRLFWAPGQAPEPACRKGIRVNSPSTRPAKIHDHRKLKLGAWTTRRVTVPRTWPAGREHGWEEPRDRRDMSQRRCQETRRTPTASWGFFVKLWELALRPVLCSCAGRLEAQRRHRPGQAG